MTQTVPSPCIDICRMDEATGWCVGCLRTLDEIALWSALDEEGKRQVWRDLQRRRFALPQRVEAAPAPGGNDPA
ncbi:MAG: DUF1289 domain-containing protein [Rubrivivax sp.]|nr:DUF1289 domain-containing protein [Rubrivivax sp.]